MEAWLEGTSACQLAPLGGPIGTPAASTRDSRQPKLGPPGRADTHLAVNAFAAIKSREPDRAERCVGVKVGSKAPLAARSEAG